MEEIERKRCNILGVGVHAVNRMTTVQLLDRAIRSGERGYVCVTGVHAIIEAQKNKELKSILNNAFLNVADGMPLVWIGCLKRFKNMGRVYGTGLMKTVCEISILKGYKHFFYGAWEGVAQDLKTVCEKKYPGIRVVGTYTPPFRPLNEEEERALIEMVAEAKPDFFWIGMSTPKQEMFMAEYMDKLDAKIMLGVSASFDIMTGYINDAPEWMRNAGLQWLHRLWQEPRRLFKRYLTCIPIFMFKITGQLLRLKKYELK